MHLYRSLDSGAPALTGTSGSLIAILKACLVDGYGSLPGAGWTMPFTNESPAVGVFKTAGTPGAYLQVKDGGPGAGSYREARIRGYETLSDYQTGTGAFPSIAQRENGYYVRKSSSLDNTPREWIIAADAHRVYSWVYTGDTLENASHWIFGKFQTDKPGDLYNYHIFGRIQENNGLISASEEFAAVRYPYLNNPYFGYIMRSYAGIGSSTPVGLYGDATRCNASNSIAAGSQGIPYPCPADGGLYMSRTYINEHNAPRGSIPGIWYPCHVKPLNKDDTFTGVEGLSAKSFLVINVAGGQMFLETSDTWDL